MLIPEQITTVAPPVLLEAARLVELAKGETGYSQTDILNQVLSLLASQHPTSLPSTE